MNLLQAAQQLGGYSLLLILLSLLATSALGQNLTYAPPPTINMTQLLSITKTSPSSFLTGSKRLEGLEITQGTTTTTFKLAFFNRSQSDYNNLYMIVDEPGLWEYVKGTQETLSCSLIYESTTQTYGLLQFLNDQGIFKILAKLPLAIVRTALPAQYATADYLQIASVFTPSENCAAGRFADKVYYLTGPADATILGLPTGWNLQAYTESFQYGITESKLYSMNLFTFQYDLIYTFEKFQAFTLKEKSGRMIITGANKTVNGTNNLPNGFLQKIYFFDTPPTGLTLISTITLNGFAFQDSFIPVFASPQLTKLGYSYIPAGSNANQQIFTKSVDYLSRQVIDITIEDPAHAFQTFLTSDPYEFDFSDYFLVIRNASGLQQNPNATAVEEAYQFVGNRIMFLDSRVLSGSMELTKFRKLQVDQYFTNNLVLIDVFDNAAGTGSDIYQVQYGNFADRRKIVPPAIKPYIQLPKPAGATSTEPSNPHNFTWTYYSVDATNPAAKKTKVDIYRINPNTADTHLDYYTKIVDGSFSMVARSTECRVLLEADSSIYVLFAYDQSISTQTMIYPLVGVVGALGVTSSNIWAVSEDCDRFIVKNTAFYLSNNTFVATNNTFGTTDTILGDSKLDYIVSSGNIWRFDNTQNKYAQLTTDAPFLGSYSATSTQDRLLISSKNFASSAWSVKLIAYVTSATGVTSFFTYSQTFSGDFEPKVSVASGLDKVVIYGGKVGSTDGQVDGFFLDYSGRSNKTIIFPTSSISEIKFTSISINADFLYVRQSLNDAQLSNATYTAIKRQEYVYYLNKGYLPQLLTQKDLTTEQATSGFWTKSLIVTQDGLKYHLAVETVETINNTQNVVVRQTEINPQQAALSSLPNQDLSGYVINGQIVLCSLGCNDCSTQTCTGCKAGFAFNANSALCISCTPGCLACDVTDPTKCSSCMNSTYLGGTQCLPCGQNCITCSGSATSCLTCTSWQYYDGAQCQPCPRNCLTCSGASTCTHCNKGFVVTPAGTCRGCAITCSDCQANDITSCTACGKGLELFGSKCLQCPDNCLLCNSGSCQTCIPGYTSNSNGLCVPNCKLPCATCVDFQPSSCLSCFASASLSSGTCVASLDCNTTGNCTDCGQGLNLFLVNGNCLPCSQIISIPNCIQCSQINQQICSICKDGFYIDTIGSCPSCPSSCTTCVGSNLCTSCQIGYTLPTDQTQGPCLQCQTPCATCSGVVKYCTSCISGFTKDGWKCLNNARIAFSITLGGNVAAVLANIDGIVAALLTMMGQNTSYVELITITSITSGSAILNLLGTPPSIASAATSLSSGLASAGTLGGLPITSTTVTTTGGASQEKTNVGLIAGLTVGLLCFAVILFVIIVCAFRSKKSDNRTAAEPLGNTTITQEKQVSNTLEKEVQDFQERDVGNFQENEMAKAQEKEATIANAGPKMAYSEIASENGLTQK